MYLSVSDGWCQLAAAQAEEAVYERLTVEVDGG